MDVSYDTIVVAGSYREALDRATAQAEAFYGNAPFRLDRARADRVAPQATVLMGPPPSPVHEVEFRFCGDPLATGPTVDGEPEPMSLEGDCPKSDLICQRGCEVVCGDAPEPVEFQVGDVVKIIDGDAYGTGLNNYTLSVGTTDRVRGVGRTHSVLAPGRTDLVDLEAYTLWVPEGLELVHRAN